MILNQADIPAPECQPFRELPPLGVRRDKRLSESLSRLTKLGITTSGKMGHHYGAACSSGPVVAGGGAVSLLSSGRGVLCLDIPWSKLVVVGLTPGLCGALDSLVALFVAAAAKMDGGDDEEAGFISVSRLQIRGAVGKRHDGAVLAIALATGVLECDESWRRATPGCSGRAKGYRLTDAALSHGLKVLPLSPRELRKRERTERRERAVRDPQLRAIRDDMRRFTLSPKAWIELLQPPAGDSMRKVCRRIAAAAAFVRGSYCIKRPRAGNRVYSRITSLPVSVRKHLLIDGKPTVEVDVSQCQALLLVARAFGSADSPEKQDVLSLIANRTFYAWICEAMGKPGLGKAQQKEEAFRYSMFARMAPDEKADAAMMARFPTIQLSTLADRAESEERFPLKNGNSYLAIELQRMEAEIMVDTAQTRLRAMGKPSATVHDGIIVNVEDARLAMDIITEAFVQHSGIRPTLRIDSLPEISMPAIIPTPQSANQPSPASGKPAEKIPTAPCPSDLCPECWETNVAYKLSSPFPCRHEEARRQLRCRAA